MARDIPIDPDLHVDSLLLVKSVVVTMEFIGTSHPKFFHQPALTAFLRHLSGSPKDYARQIRIDGLESGRIHYRTGDFYRFVIIGLHGSDSILGILFQQLQKLPRSAPISDTVAWYEKELAEMLRSVLKHQFSVLKRVFNGC